MKRLAVLLILFFAVPAQAASVAVFSDNYGPPIIPAPHVATQLSLGDIEAGALAAYDVLWIGHAAYNPGSWSAQACTEVTAFIAGGGGIVAEWNGLTFLFDALDGGAFYPMDDPQCALFTGTVGAGDSVGSDTPIDVIDGASPLMAGLSDPFSMGAGSEFFFTLSGYDGGQWTVVAEFTGHGGTWPAVLSSSALGGVVTVATMDYADVLPANATAQTLIANMIDVADSGAASTSGVSTFRVTKTFSDGRDDEVEVTLTCNSGLPLQQSFTIEGDGDGVLFVVEEIQGSDTVCEVTESGGPSGYTAEFNDGAGCTWEGVASGGQYTCAITNEADPAEYTVTKDWVVSGAVGDEVVMSAYVDIDCSSDILSIDDSPISPVSEVRVLLEGDGDSVTVEVDTSTGSTSCSAVEDITQSGIETAYSSGCTDAELVAGGSASCTITNTVFFEGIPTLSQWGMALMALLMLGVGFIGLRRFA